MDRINGAGHVDHMFVAEDVPTNRPPTEITEDWLNTIQEELAAVPEGVGMTLDPNNRTQVREAIQRMIDAQSGNYALDTGVANAYVVALSPAITAYSDGMTVRVKVVNANTGASTLNAGGGVVPWVSDVGGDLAGGDLPAGGIATVTYIANKFYTTSLVQSELDARYASILSGTPSGAVHYFAMSTAPSGWLKANGAAISRTTYAGLFAAIGTVFGVGDGSTTFNIPDLRGEFLRSWDDGRGIDTARTFGSAQADDIKSHAHVQRYSNTGGAITSIPGFSTALEAYGNAFVSTAPFGGVETRPRNIALLACIKY